MIKKYEYLLISILFFTSKSHALLGTVLNVKANDQIVKGTIVDKPFYDPKKNLANN